jgi:hypothetical protein
MSGVSRPRRHWRWSAHINARARQQGERDCAGVVTEPTTDHAFESVAREQGCRGDAMQFHYWPSGGWATYRNGEGDTVTVLVVRAE